MLVYETTYASRLTFSHREEAEQDAEKFALECIKEKLKVEDSSHYLQGSKTLQVYFARICMKKDLGFLKYTTTEAEDM